MSAAAKWIGGTVAVPVIAIALYLGAVIQVYALAWVLEGLAAIFG